ncbi:hypothetical protein AAVH_23653 [Aphelenchoides avenae]|nr:hypothetical protein AAVH_23653 [Aphelenchus avenae]
MSSELSPYAIHRILHFLDNGDRRRRTVKKMWAPPNKSQRWNVDEKWNYVYTHYFIHRRSPPMDHLRSLELALFHGKDLDLGTMRTALQEPLVFVRNGPCQFVPKILEAFHRLTENPPFRDVTIVEPYKGWPSMVLASVWPQVYIDHVHCGACMKTEHESLVVEKLHIPSKHFNKQLTVELHFTLDGLEPTDDGDVRPATAPVLEKFKLCEVTTRLENISRSGSPSETARTSKSLLLLPEFASEVYGFLDREHVGTSLIANRRLNELLFKLRNRLPVHHVSLIFEKQFEVPSKDGPAAYCALIIHHLSNSHLFAFKSPESDSRFALKMLAALANRNFSIGALRMRDDGGGLSDYRSMDVVVAGGMRLDALELSMFEHEFLSLVKTTDFFCMSTVARLKTLKPELVRTPWHDENTPRRWAIVSSPLWIAGIHQLRSRERFEVKYDSDRHLRRIGIKLVQLCEEFERGEISELVEHFKFTTSRYVDFPFIDDKKIASGMEVGRYKWDVYRFRNVTTGEWLTACVGEERSKYSHRSVLHIVKGEAYPDATFDAE